MSFNAKQKYIWFRVYKCASRSIDDVLYQYRGYQYRGQSNYFPSLYKKYYKFAFIRNPIDRFKSCYLDKVISDKPFQGRGSKPVSRYFPKMGINTFIEYISVKGVDNISTDEHIRSQISMIDLLNVDFIGRVENFDADFRIVLNAIGINIYSIPHINKDKGEIELTSIQESKIKKMYRKDYELWEDNRK